MGGRVFNTPVQATVRTLGASILPQLTNTGGTGASSTLPFQDCFKQIPPSGEKRAEKKKLLGSLSFSLPHQLALVTLPERRQRVQAYTWQGLPSTTAFTRFTLGFQVRFARRWEWETLIPKATPFPQKSHFAIFCTSCTQVKGAGQLLLV